MVTGFPDPAYPVGLHKHSAGAKSGYNIGADVYTPPKNQPGTQYLAYGPSPLKSSEPKLAGHDRVVVDTELYTPAGFPAGPHDLVDLLDGQYEVIGYPEDYTHSPFPGGDFGGLVVNLRKVDF